VCGKPPEKIDTSAVTAFVGRDFGYVNTIALSVCVVNQAVDLDGPVTADDTRQAARRFFETHRAPEQARIVERVMFSGRRFLEAIERHSLRIDQYRSRIDQHYNALHALSHQLKVHVGIDAAAPIERSLTRGPHGDKVREFFHLLGKIHDLKNARRRLYPKIAAIKKNWFGMLSSAEAELARKYNAVVVCENLDAVAEGKDKPGYKGRTFNKMLNNGSKGQYRRMASAKLLWNGIPEKVIPSWYTSRACVKHAAIVEKKHRRGESIFLPCCQSTEHADWHASDTISQYLLLHPIDLPRQGVVTTTPGATCPGKHRPLGR
jgi:hypothetical protein